LELSTNICFTDTILQVIKVWSNWGQWLENSRSIVVIQLNSIAATILRKAAYTSIDCVLHFSNTACFQSIVKPFSKPGYLVGSWWRTPLRHPPKITIDQ
jgi:hypothetical protein